MIHPMVETTSMNATKPAHTKKWLKYRTGRHIDDKSIWMFIDGSSTGWHAAVILNPFTKKITRIAKFRKPNKSANVGAELMSLVIGLQADEAEPDKRIIVVHDYIGTGAWLVKAWKIKSPEVLDIVQGINYTIDMKAFTSVRFIHHGGHQKDDTDFTRWNNEVDQLCTNQQEVHATVCWNPEF
jgi:hypothetical protein